MSKRFKPILVGVLLSTCAVSAHAQTVENNYAASFVLRGVAAGDRLPLGLPLRLELVPTSDPIDIVYVDADSLRVFLRHVQLKSFTEDQVVKRFPIPILNTVDVLPRADTVEAWMVTGKIPLGFRDLAQQLSVDVRWTFSTGSGGSLSETLDIRTYDTDSPLAIDVLFAPRFTTWTLAPGTTLPDALAAVSTSARRIKAEVKVSGPTGSSNWVTVADIDVKLPDLPVPDVAVAFEHDDYDGAAMVLFPSGSPLINADGALTVLRELSGTIQDLGTFTQFASLGNTLDVIVDALEGASLTVLGPDNVDHNLHNNHVEVDKLLGCDWCNPDDRWGDFISSVALISFTRELDFFEHRSEEGHRLTLDPPSRYASARIRSLHSKVPSSSPANAVDLSDSTPDMPWGDKISSYKWD